jgi:hypothetical protein
MHRFPSEAPEYAARQSVSRPLQRWCFVPSSEVELVRQQRQCGVTGYRCILVFCLAILCWNMLSLLEYAFEYLIFLRLDGISLGYKGQPR